MKLSSLLKTSLAVLLVTGISSAQTVRPKGQKPAVQARAQQQQKQAKPIPASAPLKRSKVEARLSLPVMGLTAENAEQIKSSLSALKVQVYDCDQCKAKFAKAGDCPSCKVPLTAADEVVLKSISLDPTKHEIVVTTEPGMELRLAQVEHALRSKDVKIDGSKLMLSGDATLHVSGASSAEQAQAIQAALVESKLFKGVRAMAHGNGIMIRVMAAATPPTRAQVQDVLTKANAEYKLRNVIWNDWNPRVRAAKDGAKRR